MLLGGCVLLNLSEVNSSQLGPDVWIPIQMCAWSVITMVQFFLKGKTTFLVTRALLGFVKFYLISSRLRLNDHIVLRKAALFPTSSFIFPVSLL